MLWPLDAVTPPKANNMHLPLLFQLVPYDLQRKLINVGNTHSFPHSILQILIRRHGGHGGWWLVAVVVVGGWIVDLSGVKSLIIPTTHPLK